MNPPSLEPLQLRPRVPETVAVILKELARRHASGEYSDRLFAEKLHRLSREELTPLGMLVRVGPLQGGGGTHFQITRRGEHCASIECRTLQPHQRSTRHRRETGTK